MSALNLSDVFFDVDGVLNDLLSKYTKLRFISYNQASSNTRQYLTNEITKGFYYKARRLPVTGEVVERLKFVPENSTIETIIKSGKVELIELKDDVGNFVRFRFNTYREPNPPNMEWWFDIVPNKQDTGVIT
jgi:hypothetical protein